jgi:hypothetical protein
LFTLKALPWHWLYFLYSGFCFGLGVFLFFASRLRGMLRMTRQPRHRTPDEQQARDQLGSSLESGDAEL